MIMALKNMKKQKAHVRELHKRTGLGKPYVPKVTTPATENITVTMPSSHRKMSWLDRIVALWM